MTSDDTRSDALDSEERVLADALGPVPAPRRTDAAFARSVAADVRDRRRGASWGLSALGAAAAAGCLALFVSISGGEVSAPDAGPVGLPAADLFAASLEAMATDEERPVTIAALDDEALLSAADLSAWDAMDEDEETVVAVDDDGDEDDDLDLGFATLDDDLDDGSLLAFADALDSALAQR
jgi:hypothetical protein